MRIYTAPFAQMHRRTGVYSARGGWWIKKNGSGWDLIRYISGQSDVGEWIHHGKHKTLTAAVAAYKTQMEA